MTRRRWLPRVAVLRPSAQAGSHAHLVLERLERSLVPVIVSSEPWTNLASRLGVHSRSSARAILVVESSPPRNVRPEAFPGVTLRPDAVFATHGFNCPFQCEYCYLFVNSAGIEPVMAYTDIRTILDSIGEAIRTGTHIVNVGEDSDSLAIEHLTGTAGVLIEAFQSGDSTLELRTKSPLVEELLSLHHGGRTVIAISFAASPEGHGVEHGTAGLAERARSARLYSAAGYGVALKFEPGILTAHWEGRYSRMLARLQKEFDAVGTAPHHASLGCLRFKAQLAALARSHHPRSELFLGPWEEYLPGRYSYPRAQRLRFYTFMASLLWRFWPLLPIYVSMEPQDVLEELGASPWMMPRRHQLVSSRNEGVTTVW